MKILVIGSKSFSLVNFRGEMLKEFHHRGHEVVAVAPDYEAEIAEILQGWGIGYENVFLNRTGTNLVQDFRTFFSLLKMFRKQRPDLVLSYTIKPVIFASVAASFCRVPKIFSMITGLGWVFNRQHRLKAKLIQFWIIALYRFAARKNTGLIFQNPDDMREFLGRNIIDQGRAFMVNGSGVDVSHYSFSQPPEGPPGFIFIGRLLKEKGLMEYVAAAEILKKKYPEAVFEVLGRLDSNPGAISETEYRRLQEDPAINMLPETPDVRPYLKRSSVFVLPSYREGTPRTALEAMATGRPLVMADSPGCRETVMEGENGFLVPVKDPVALAGAMEKFIRNPELIGPMGKRSREIAEEKYDVKKVNQDIIRILEL